MSKDNSMQFSLTGKNSHTVNIPLGQGSLSIGALGMDAKKFDVLVDKNIPINWNCFNSFFTGHGKEQAHSFPYGDWPRFFYYWGNDSSFIEWSNKRKIEDFTWCPQIPISVDFSKANINRLTIVVEVDKIKVRLGTHSFFALAGNLQNINLTGIGAINSISFAPNVSDKDDIAPYKLPLFEVLKNVKSISIQVDPLGQAFDCESLLYFENLTNLSLSGNLTNLQSLGEIKHLESLAMRYVPNLENLPALRSWKKLTSFIGWNIEATKGKLLRSELKRLIKERKLKYSSVSQLRKLIWFTAEYKMPFSGWSGKNAKLAVKTYKGTLKKLKKATEEKEIKELLIEFTKAFNNLAQIETTEREDIGEAVNQLRQIPSVEIEAKKANKWFDDARDY